MIYTVSSLHAVGCTFLDWSILYLSGKDQFFSTKKNSLIPITSNPLTTTNAHNHDRNHPNGYVNTVKGIELFKKNDPTDLYSMYFTELRVLDSITDLNNSTDWNEIKNHKIDDYKKIWSFLQQESIPLIFVDSNDAIYSSLLRAPRTSVIAGKSFNFESLSQRQDIVEHFFKGKNEHWGNGPSDTTFKYIWDYREFVALTFDFTDLFYKNEDLNQLFVYDHYYLDANSLWFNGERTLSDILDFLNLKVSSDRYDQWLPVYRQWSAARAKELKFSWELDHICESIVNNFNLDLTVYNLDVMKEAIIQQFLIRKYNLNLKTWQLEKFPDNAKDLHKLLEPNFHGQAS